MQTRRYAKKVRQRDRRGKDGEEQREKNSREKKGLKIELPGGQIAIEMSKRERERKK